MTRWGIGPKWSLACIACVVPFIIARKLWPDIFAIQLLSAPALAIAGGVLLAIGIPFFVTALRTLHRGFLRSELFTRGVYGCCRHPIYSSWIVFIVPGVLLLQGSWAFVIAPFLMYALLRLFVHKEETWLEETFQDQSIQNLGMTSTSVSPKMCLSRKWSMTSMM